MLKKLFSVHDVESDGEAIVKGAVLGLAIVGAISITYDLTTLVVRSIVRNEIEKL